MPPQRAAPAVAVLAEGELRLFDASARALKSLSLPHVTSPLLRCWQGTALVLSATSWGKLVSDARGSDIHWSKISAEPKGCVNAVEIRDAVPSASGGLCVALSDGFADTANCEQSFDLDPSSGRLGSGCQIAEFESTGTTIASPSGRYRVEFRDPAEGDEAYFRSVHVSDREGERPLKFEGQSLLQRDARADWLPGERALVIPGRLLTLPALQVVSEGAGACVLQDP